LTILLLIAAGVAGALWYYRATFMPVGDEMVVQQPVVSEAPEQTGPRYPLTPPEQPESNYEELEPLPALADSDDYFALSISENFGPDAVSMLVNRGLIERFVATVDNLPRSELAERIRPVHRTSGTLAVDPLENDDEDNDDEDNGDEDDRDEDNREEFYLSSVNYSRYDLFVLAANADPDVIAAVYRRFYPLFQEAYVGLGYPEGYFNDRVVAAIDNLLQTPEPDEPILLVRPHVLYEFADEDLEARSSGQKLMLRMGSNHAATIKQALQQLRPLIAGSNLAAD
jgi:hypothetical protein